MQLTLYTEGFFDAAHFIQGHPGKCALLHGHSWKLCVWVNGDSDKLDDNGILWDFGNIKRMIELFDHKVINEELEGNPTAERLVLFIYHMLKKESPELLFKIRVYENLLSKQSYCEGGDLVNV